MAAFDEWMYHHHAASLFAGTQYYLWDPFVYPPGYPLVLSVAFFFKSHFYDAMLLTNCLVYTAAIFPAYGLARRMMPRELALAAAVTVALIPFPANVSFLMAENLAIPLFMLALLLLLEEEIISRSWLRAVFVGVLSAACFLTKFILLPGSIALLIFFILFEVLRYYRSGTLIQAARNSVVAVSSFCALLGLWLIYARSQNLEIKNALGMVASDTVFNTGQFKIDQVFVWVVLYLTYLGTLIAPFLAPILALTPLDWRVRLASLAGEPNKIVAILRDFTFRFEIITLGFLSFYMAVTLVHDLSFLVNAERPSMMSSRYFDFLFPLLVLLAFRRVSALIECPIPRSAQICMLAIGLTGSAIVAFGWAVFGQRAVFDIGSYVTGVHGVHTTTYSLWFNNVFLTIWLLSPFVVAAAILFLKRSEHIAQLGITLFLLSSILATASAYGWSVSGRGRMPIGSSQVNLARGVGALLFGSPSKQKAVIFYPTNAVNFSVLGKGVLDLYGSFFSGNRYDVHFAHKDFYTRPDSIRDKGIAFYTLKPKLSAACLGTVKDPTLGAVKRAALCPCAIEAPPSSDLHCGIATNPITDQHQGTIAAYSVIENANDSESIKSIFNEKWQVGNFGAQTTATRATFSLPLRAQPTSDQYKLRMRLSSVGWQEIVVSVNGVVVGNTIVKNRFPGGWYSFTVPTTLLKNRDDVQFEIRSADGTDSPYYSVTLLEVSLAAQ